MLLMLVKFKAEEEGDKVGEALAVGECTSGSRVGNLLEKPWPGISVLVKTFPDIFHMS